MRYKEIREKSRIFLWEKVYRKERHKSDTKWSYKKKRLFILERIESVQNAWRLATGMMWIKVLCENRGRRE